MRSPSKRSERTRACFPSPDTSVDFLGFMMNKLILPALALATLMGALVVPAQAQNLAIVNGKPVPRRP